MAIQEYSFFHIRRHRSGLAEKPEEYIIFLPADYFVQSGIGVNTLGMLALKDYPLFDSVLGSSFLALESYQKQISSVKQILKLREYDPDVAGLNAVHEKFLQQKKMQVQTIKKKTNTGMHIKFLLDQALRMHKCIDQSCFEPAEYMRIQQKNSFYYPSEKMFCEAHKKSGDVRLSYEITGDYEETKNLFQEMLNSLIGFDMDLTKKNVSRFFMDLEWKIFKEHGLGKKLFRKPDSSFVQQFSIMEYLDD